MVGDGEKIFKKTPVGFSLTFDLIPLYSPLKLYPKLKNT